MNPLDLLTQAAAQYPLTYGGAAAAIGFAARQFLFTKEAARKLVKFYFDRQRAALRRRGVSEEKIKALMEEEASLLTNIAQEAKAQADAEPAPAAPAAPPAAG